MVEIENGEKENKKFGKKEKIQRDRFPIKSLALRQGKEETFWRLLLADRNRQKHSKREKRKKKWQQFLSFLLPLLLMPSKAEFRISPSSLILSTFPWNFPDSKPYPTLVYFRTLSTQHHETMFFPFLILLSSFPFLMPLTSSLFYFSFDDS